MAGLSSLLLVAAGALMTASALRRAGLQLPGACRRRGRTSDVVREKQPPSWESLCTDADYDFCADLCKNEMNQFNHTLDSKVAPFHHYRGTDSSA
uniref:Putative secreted protein n=1 Tax=Ixodes ricinus TaxID=34613 RepID=A0A090X802_IXORI